MEEECKAVLIKLENQFLFFKYAAQFDLKGIVLLLKIEGKRFTNFLPLYV